MKQCSVEGCNRVHDARGLCYVHYYEANKEAVSKRSKERRIANLELYRNRDKENYQKLKSLKEFKAKRAANEAKRRANKKQATPIWSDLDEIKKVYINCPIGFEVDHIIPLQGENVCGLHVHWNLQYLTPTENKSKNNRLKVA